MRKASLTIAQLLLVTTVACGARQDEPPRRPPPPPSDSACVALEKLEIEHVTILRARVVSAAGSELDSIGVPPGRALRKRLEKLAPFCRVKAVSMPVPDSRIGFEVWMPLDGWNGKFLGNGNGSFGGSINYPRLADAVDAGYASASTDTGHEGAATDSQWAGQNTESVADFKYRATHEMTIHAKALIEAFYARPVAFSYFNSCSNGGRQGIVEAGLFPRDYDGILAGAPALNFSRGLARRFGLKMIDETQMDLRSFAARGGKLIIYHGANDRPEESIAFHQRLVRELPPNVVENLVHLYVIPGMGHCGGGPVSELWWRVAREADPDHNMQAALERWVEKGVPPNAAPE